MSDLKPVKISGELFWTKWMAEFNKAFNEATTVTNAPSVTSVMTMWLS